MVLVYLKWTPNVPMGTYKDDNIKLVKMKWKSKVTMLEFLKPPPPIKAKLGVNNNP